MNDDLYLLLHSPEKLEEGVKRVARGLAEDAYDNSDLVDIAEWIHETAANAIEGRRRAAIAALANIEIRKEFYYEYLKSPAWKAKADAAKERAGYRCEVCNSNRRIEAHHRTYNNLGNEAEGDITVLCHECHELFSKNGRLAK